MIFKVTALTDIHMHIYLMKLNTAIANVLLVPKMSECETFARDCYCLYTLPVPMHQWHTGPMMVLEYY